MDFSRKKLNNKGFTLIELLAVVAILGIIMGLIWTSVFNPLNSTRRSSLYSASNNAARNLNMWVTEDSMVVNSSEKKVGQKFLNATMSGEWICLSSSLEINNGGKPTSLMKALGLSEKDILIGTNYVAETKDDNGKATSNPSCSAVRYNSRIGGYEILLVAAIDGKYYVNGDKLYFAYSNAGNFNESIDD